MDISAFSLFFTVFHCHPCPYWSYRISGESSPVSLLCCSRFSSYLSIPSSFVSPQSSWSVALLPLPLLTTLPALDFPLLNLPSRLSLTDPSDTDPCFSCNSGSPNSEILSWLSFVFKPMVTDRQNQVILFVYPPALKLAISIETRPNHITRSSQLWPFCSLQNTINFSTSCQHARASTSR